MAGRALIVLTAALLGSASSAPAWAAPGLDDPMPAHALLERCASLEDRQPAQAIALANSVLAMASSSGVTRASALGCRGWALASTGQPDKAASDAHAMVGALATLADHGDHIALLRRAGGILHRSDQRASAIEYYARALALALKQGSEREQIPLLANLGVLYAEFEEHARAHANFEQALALMQRTGDTRHEAPVRLNLGLTLNGQRRYADAAVHLRRALALAGSQAPAQYRLAIRLALAKALMSTGQRQEGMALAREIARATTGEDDPNANWNVASVKASLLALEGKAADALATIERVPRQRLAQMQQVGWLEERARMLEQLGRLPEALHDARLASELREKHLRQLNHERLAAADAHVRNVEQRQELERLQAQALVERTRRQHQEKTQHMLAIIAGVLLCGGVGVLVWQRRLNRLLRRASDTDPLTGLANRRAMAAKMAALGPVTRKCYALFLLDVDHFKRVNDSFGHDVGDEVLVSYAQRLQRFVGAQGWVARWGGEEFVVLMPADTATRAGQLAGELQAMLSQPLPTRVGPLRTTASIGICQLPLPGGDVPNAWQHPLHIADAALYAAKGQGRDAWVAYWPSQTHDQWSAERMARETALALVIGVLERSASATAFAAPMCEQMTRDLELA